MKTLAELRKSRCDMSQSELASALQVGQSTVAMWETGDRVPTLTMAKRIAEFFGVRLDEIFFGPKTHIS